MGGRERGKLREGRGNGGRRLKSLRTCAGRRSHIRESAERKVSLRDWTEKMRLSSLADGRRGSLPLSRWMERCVRSRINGWEGFRFAKG